jgi:hypothetical protein
VSLPFAGLFGNAGTILFLKFNSLLQVIFRAAYWLRFLAQLQHKEQAKDTLINMSRNVEAVALQIANRGWNDFYRLP